VIIFSKKALGVYLFAVLTCLYFLEQGAILALLLAPMFILNKNWRIVIVLITPIVGGGVDNSGAISFELTFGLYVLIFTIPSLLVRPRIPSVASYFLLGLLLLILGEIVGLINGDNLITTEFITFNGRVLYMIAISYRLSFLENEDILSGLKFVSTIIPLVIILVVVKMLTDDIRVGLYKNYLNYGSTSHGSFSSYLSFLWILYLGFFRTNERRSYAASIMTLLLGIFCMYAIVLSASKNGMAIFTVMTLLTLYLTSKRKTGAIGLILFVSFIGLTIFQGIDDNPLLRRFELSDDITTGRADLLLGGIELASKNIIVGVGNSSSVVRSELYALTGLDNLSHNVVLEYLIRYGIAGFLYVAIPMILVLYNFAMLFLTRQHKHTQTAPFLFGVTSVLISSMAISYTWSTNLMIPYALYFILNKKSYV